MKCGKPLPRLSAPSENTAAPQTGVQPHEREKAMPQLSAPSENTAAPQSMQQPHEREKSVQQPYEREKPVQPHDDFASSATQGGQPLPPVEQTVREPVTAAHFGYPQDASRGAVPSAPYSQSQYASRGAVPSAGEKRKPKLTVLIAAGAAIVILAAVGLFFILSNGSDDPTDTADDIRMSDDDGDDDTQKVKPTPEPTPELTYGEALLLKYADVESFNPDENIVDLVLTDVYHDGTDIYVKVEFKTTNTIIIALLMNFIDEEDHTSRINGLDCEMSGNIGDGEELVFTVPKTVADKGMIVLFGNFDNESLFFVVELGDEPHIVAGPLCAGELFADDSDDGDGASGDSQDANTPSEDGTLDGAWPKAIADAGWGRNITWNGEAVVFTANREVMIYEVYIRVDGEEYELKRISNTKGNMLFGGTTATPGSSMYISSYPTLPEGTTVECTHDDDYSHLSPDEIVIILSDEGYEREYTFYRQN